MQNLMSKSEINFLYLFFWGLYFQILGATEKREKYTNLLFFVILFFHSCFSLNRHQRLLWVSMYARTGLSGLFLWGFWFLLSLSLRLFHTIPLSGFGSGRLSSGWYSLLLIPMILFFWLGPCESEIRFLFAGQDYFERKDALALRYIDAGNY